MRRLLRRSADDDGDGVDLRPALLSVVALLFLLLPFALLTTSLDKLTGLALWLDGGPEGAASGEAEHAARPERVERVEVHLQGDELSVHAAIRAADVTAGPGDAPVQRTSLPAVDGALDLDGLQARLRELRRLDPDQHGVTLIAGDDQPTARVVTLIDAIRGGADAPLYDEVQLGSPAAPGAPGGDPALAEAPPDDPATDGAAP